RLRRQRRRGAQLSRGVRDGRDVPRDREEESVRSLPRDAVDNVLRNRRSRSDTATSAVAWSFYVFVFNVSRLAGVGRGVAAIVVQGLPGRGIQAAAHRPVGGG